MERGTGAISRWFRQLIDEGAMVSSRFSTPEPHMLAGRYAGSRANYEGVTLRDLQRHAAHLDERFGEIAGGADLSDEDVYHFVGMARLLGRLSELERACCDEGVCPNCAGELVDGEAVSLDAIQAMRCTICQYEFEETIA